jgi:hypothetical protein
MTPDKVAVVVCPNAAVVASSAAIAALDVRARSSLAHLLESAEALQTLIIFITTSDQSSVVPHEPRPLLDWLARDAGRLIAPAQNPVPRPT